MSYSYDMKVFYADTYDLPLPDGHRFPINKYKLLREKLLENRILTKEHLHEAIPAQLNDIYLAHTKEYVEGIKNQTLDKRQMRKIGLPVGDDLWKRVLASVGGYLNAVEASFEYGFSSSLSGGTHHAHADSGEGFCVFNDFAIACRKYPNKNFLIIDLDVHQGNGNSSILRHDDNVFIFSMHGEKNYPFKKIPSHLDVALKDGCEDTEYLDKLKSSLNNLSKLKFDTILYQAGVDALVHDSLGTLNLSFQGLRERDQLVFEFTKKHNANLAMALGGGYSRPIEHTVEAYLNTYKEVKKAFNL
jgi:acetoin utilization deacetylase AcuC-like enzyme